MKIRNSFALAAVLAAGALPFAHADAPSYRAISENTFLEEPAASTSIPEGADQGVAGTIAQQLNADASLKHTKITVQPNGEGILLTGSTATQVQRIQAGKIATAQAGEGKVLNTIIADEALVPAPQPQQEAARELDASDVASGDAMPERPAPAPI